LGHANLIGDFAFRLPVTVICEMLGIPDEDHEMFLNGARDGGRLLDPVPLTRAELDAANAGNLAAAAYFQQLFELRRRQPGDDLTTRLAWIPTDSESAANRAAANRLRDSFDSTNRF
jgi:cytochrome P450